MNKGNRNRNIKLQFYVTQEEKDIINKRMEIMHTNNFSIFARKMCMDGLMIYTDLSEFKEYSKEVNAIGRNINQAVKILHNNPSDEEIKKALVEGLKKVWQLQRSILSSLH